DYFCLIWHDNAWLF
nr:immunoglobulin light chain junction region [Macaca mulatta]MOY10024.1 immunoglobulin light chain junction region [Macaca mulatta]